MANSQNRAWNKKPSMDFLHFSLFWKPKPCRFKGCMSQCCTFFWAKWRICDGVMIWPKYKIGFGMKDPDRLYSFDAFWKPQTLHNRMGHASKSYIFHEHRVWHGTQCTQPYKRKVELKIWASRDGKTILCCYFFCKLLQATEKCCNFSFVVVAGRGMSLTRGRSFAQSQEVDEDVDSLGEPRQRFCEYSFRCIHAENPVRKTCIRILMSP